MTESRVVTINPEPIPQELKERDQWLLWDNSHDTPRQPHWKGDFHISWSDPDDWHSFPEALAAAEKRDSWGIGYVMALENDGHARGLYGCLDLDGCLTAPESPKEWLPSLSSFVEDGAYIERSPSGDGLHIPLVGQDAPDWWRDSHFSDDEHEGVEYLTNKFVTFTGDQLGDQHDGVADIDPTEFLFESYETLNGEAPRDPDVPEGGRRGDGDDLEKEDVREALSHLDSNVGYPEWRNIAFAVHDWDSGRRGKSLFEQWSRGPAWDDDSQNRIDAIWRSADNASGNEITIGTLIHRAMQAGWEPPGYGSDDYDGTPSVKELVARYNDQFDDASDVPDVFDEDDEADDEDEDDGRPVPPDEPTTTGTESDTDDSDSDGDHEPPSWEAIHKAYKVAEDADERLPARHNAAKRLLKESDWRNFKENDQLWRYHPETGIYEPDGEATARTRLSEQLKAQFKTHEKKEILDQVRARETVPEDVMGGPPNHIAAENCVIKITSDGAERVEHDADYNFVGRVQTPYNPDAECPRFRQFLQESVDGDSDRQKLQEFAGYALHHWGLPFHKALFLVGPTASGKSTFLDAIRTMLGNDAVASLTPQQMTSERFGGAELYGAWANIRNDIPNNLIENTGQFKELVAGDPIKAEEKFKDPFMFEPAAKHMFSANELPPASVDDRAFYRRILLVAFPHEVPRNERDPHLDDKLQSEHPGMLNWALDGLIRLRQQGGFTGDRPPWETEDTWEAWSDSIKRFYETCLEHPGDGDIRTADVYGSYVAFCRDEGIPEMSGHKELTHRLNNRFEIATGRTYMDSDDRQRVLVNVEFTERGKEMVNDYQS